MNRTPRHAEFSWPVARADLDAMEVLEAIPSPEGQVLWLRRELRPRIDELPEPLRLPAWDDLLARRDAYVAPDTSAPPALRLVLAAPVSGRRHIPRAAMSTLERCCLIAMGLLVGAALAIIVVPGELAIIAPAPSSPASTSAASFATPLASPAGLVTPAAALDAAVGRGLAPDRSPHARVNATTSGHRPDPPSASPGATLPSPRASSATAPATTLTSGPAPPPADASMPVVDAAPGVIDAIRRYAAAYNRLDATATQAVWRSADRAQLVQVFTGLREQRLTLRDCVVHASGNDATATCRGTLRYRPRVGEHSTISRAGRWDFVLGRGADAWVIYTIAAP